MTRAQAVEETPHQAAAHPAPPVEAPSGKGAGDENFPVGSWLIAKKLRGHVAAFYAFARAIDDIADNASLASEEKLARLERMDQALLGKDDDIALATAHACRRSLEACRITVQHCRDLITAFKGDATKLRYTDWDELIAGYCRYSASPVGRYLLDLHGEDKAGYANSDALCDALQVINHLQDCRDDYRTLDRVYLPGDWLAAAGARIEDLDAAAATPGLRVVFEQCLDGVDELLVAARALPGRLRSRRLAMEAAAIVRIAEDLAAALRRRDPVAERVELSKPRFLWCLLRGVFDTWLGRARRNAA
ncbi:MAG TPA: squalene synthase HpnC [Alphaproteobacteria bacterium]|nr:squalene synthase HpnC [Alphaproteobacteria bacterium]